MIQIKSQVELRQFAIEQANILASKSKIYTVENLIDAAKKIENYVKGNSKLRETPKDDRELYGELLAAMTKPTFNMSVADSKESNNDKGN